MTEEIIILIAPRLKDREQLPERYTALTVPVSIDSGAEIIRSMWSTLSCAPDTLVTLEDRCLVFWRKKRRKLSYHDSAVIRGQILKGAIQTK